MADSDKFRDAEDEDLEAEMLFDPSKPENRAPLAASQQPAPGKIARSDKRAAPVGDDDDDEDDRAPIARDKKPAQGKKTLGSPAPGKRTFGTVAPKKTVGSVVPKKRAAPVVDDD